MESVDGEGDVIETGHHGGEARSPGVVAIFVPPAILEKVQAVFDLPVAAAEPQQIRRSHLLGVETADVKSRIARDNLTLLRAEFSIDSQGDLAARQVQRLTYVVGIL